jgi:hypothetical protein
MMFWMGTIYVPRWWRDALDGKINLSIFLVEASRKGRAEAWRG